MVFLGKNKYFGKSSDRRNKPEKYQQMMKNQAKSIPKTMKNQHKIDAGKSDETIMKNELKLSQNGSQNRRKINEKHSKNQCEKVMEKGSSGDPTRPNAARRPPGGRGVYRVSQNISEYLFL